MKELSLDKGQVALIDDEDYEELIHWTWYAKWDEHIQGYYAARTQKIGGRNVTIRMHRELMKAPAGTLVDHENHNTLDNQKHNLRICTVRQNNYNKAAPLNHPSGHIGVNYRKDAQKWVAFIWVVGKRIWLGYHDTKDAAIAVRKNAEKKYYGEFAFKELKVA